MEQVNHDVVMTDINDVDLVAASQSIEQVVAKCQRFFYDEINSLPEGTIQFGEDLLYAAGEVFGSIVYEGLRSCRSQLLAEQTPVEEIKQNLEELTRFAEGCFHSRLHMLINKDVAAAEGQSQE